MCITDYTCRVLFICKYTDTFSRCAPLKTIDIQDRWRWQSGTRTTRMMRRRKSKRMESSLEVSLDISFTPLWYLLLFLSFQLYLITFLSSMWWCSMFLFDCIPKKTASQPKLKSNSLFIIRLQSHRERQLGVSGWCIQRNVCQRRRWPALQLWP